MINIIKQEIDMEESVKRRLDIIYVFLIPLPRLSRVDIEPHRIIIKNITFLASNYSNDIYIKNLKNKIKLLELEDYLKDI